MNKIFVYGTLKSDKIQYELFGKVLKKVPAKLNDYSLFEAEDGWYFIEKSNGKTIDGYIIELNNEDLKICDAFEYCPSMYRRKNVNVLVKNEVLKVDVYIRIDDVGNCKEITNYNTYSKLNEDTFIKTEIKKFKEIEHPEFYS